MSPFAQARISGAAASPPPPPDSHPGPGPIALRCGACGPPPGPPSYGPAGAPPPASAPGRAAGWGHSGWAEAAGAWADFPPPDISVTVWGDDGGDADLSGGAADSEASGLAELEVHGWGPDGGSWAGTVTARTPSCAHGWAGL